ncbi:MAG: IMP dehydrogenase [Acidobacteria bacterium]|nr:IMP dehydrogenase [Acidobacteriota bacterium]
MLDEKIREALTFDDVLILPAKSDVIPQDASVKTRLSRHVTLNIPVVSAAMDTVTTSRMAIALAQQGGLGVVHRNLSIESQAEEVDKVKRHESGMVVEPITLRPQDRISRALEVMREHHISGLPITDGSNKLVGILTNRDIRFEKRLNLAIEQIMTRKLVTVPVGTSLEEAEKVFHDHKIEKLLVVDDQFHLKGLITYKDILKRIQYPDAAKDGFGRLRVGAAVGVGADFMDRTRALLAAKCDVIVVDNAHGHSQRVLDTVRTLKREFSGVEVVAGNIGTARAAEELVDLGVDAVKVGVGPGSICTTRIITGAGIPQITAIADVAAVCGKAGVPVIADGGIKYSGDAAKAIAAGADSIMLGNLLAGTDEAPGEVVMYQGRAYKRYRGMGSIAVMKEGKSGDRYQQDGQTNVTKLVPEGIEGQVPYKGSTNVIVQMLVGGLRAGMGYAGCRTIEEFKAQARFIKITQASLKESHVHDVVITQEAPNYHLD